MDSRFSYIEQKIYWDGVIKREYLRSAFSLSESTANLSLRAYIQAHPESIERNGNRGYRATAEFKLHYYIPDISHSTLPMIESSIKHPAISRTTIDALSQSERNGLELIFSYENANSQASIRCVEPIAIVHSDGLPSLLHSWCLDKDDYRNFDLSRMESTRTGNPLKDHHPIKLINAHIKVPLIGQKQYGHEINMQVPEGCIYRLAGNILSNPYLCPEAHIDALESIKKAITE